MKFIKEKRHVEYIVTIILILFTFSCLISCGKKEEDYRQIQVYKIDGTATVARQGSSMDAYENMQLQSGDIIETIAESYLQLKLDEDKYILVEPESKISLQATGNSVDSKTSIYLEKGAIVNQLDNPLSEDSSYDVTTPNSTMAVRGTTFRVEITYDEKGESHAKVAVYGGKVECNLVFPDGTIAEPVMIEPGTEVLIWGDDVESEYVMTGKADYDDLKIKVIDFLGVIIDRGEELSISKEELDALKEAKETLEEEPIEEEPIEEEPIEEEPIEEEIIEEETLEEKTKEEEPVEEEKKEQPTTTTPIVVPNSPSDESSSDETSDGSSDDSSSSGSSSTPTTPPEPTRNVTINFVIMDNNTEHLFATKTITGVAVTETSVGIYKPLLVPGSNPGSCWSISEVQYDRSSVQITSYFGDAVEIEESIDAGTEDVIIKLYWWGAPQA